MHKLFWVFGLNLFSVSLAFLASPVKRCCITDLPGFSNYSVSSGVTFAKFGDRPYDESKPTILHIPGLEFSALSLSQYVLANQSVSNDYNLVYACINNTWAPTLQEIVYAIDSHLEEIGYQNVTVVGESSGAIIALQLGMIGSANGVVVINSATAYNGSNVEKFMKIAGTLDKCQYRTLCLLYAVFGQYNPDYRDVLVDKAKLERMTMMLTNLFLFPREVLVQRAQNWIVDSSWSINSSVRNLNYPVPVLIVASRHDEIFDSITEARRLKRLLPNSSIVHISGAGHMVAPERFPLYKLIKMKVGQM